jgi:hypothetical protein
VIGWASIVQAQTVQLPTLNSFSMGTSVLVPDHGTVGAGGIRRTGSSWRGYGPLPGGRATGGTTSAAGARASVVIHDFEQMDADLLAGENNQALNAASADGPEELLIAGRLPSVAEIRRMKAAQAQKSKAVASIAGKRRPADTTRGRLAPSRGTNFSSTARK